MPAYDFSKKRRLKIFQTTFLYFVVQWRYSAVSEAASSCSLIASNAASCAATPCSIFDRLADFASW